MSLVRYEIDGAVATITLDRPPVNALSSALVGDLEEAIAKAADPAVRAVIITGSPHFAAGADITEFRAAFEAGGRDALASRLSVMVRKLERLAKPVIAAVRGYALGGGLELAMGADFRVLASDAKVGQPEIKLGIIPGAGGTQRLTRLVGLSAARDIVYSGRFVDAEEAKALGLADGVVDPDELDAHVGELARRYATGPTAAIAAAKEAINEGVGMELDDALALEERLFAASFGTEDAREGVDAFLEKRDPGFSGR